jgi:hypothetical protein
MDEVDTNIERVVGFESERGVAAEAGAAIAKSVVYDRQRRSVFMAAITARGGRFVVRRCR